MFHLWVDHGRTAVFLFACLLQTKVAAVITANLTGKAGFAVVLLLSGELFRNIYLPVQSGSGDKRHLTLPYALETRISSDVLYIPGFLEKKHDSHRRLTVSNA